MSIQVQSLYPFFTAANGSPLNEGYIYVGEPNSDPEENPVACYFDAGLTIPAAQPLRTQNGYIVNGGSPATVYTAVAYSIRVRAKNGTQVFYRALVDGSGTTADVTTLAQLKASFPRGAVILSDPELRGLFFWTLGNYAGTVDNVNVVQSDYISPGVGAWVRQDAKALTYLLETGERLQNLRDKIKGVGIYLSDFDGFDPEEDMADQFEAAVAYCQANGIQVLRTGPYQVKIGRKVSLSGDPIAIVGEASPPVQGSSPSGSGFTWIGGEDDMFSLITSRWEWSNLTLLNEGDGISPFEMRGQRYVFDHCYCTSNSPSPKPWSDVMCRPYLNEGGYTIWNEPHYLGAGPGIVHWSALSVDPPGNGTTTAFFLGGLVESTADGSPTILKVSGPAQMDGAYFWRVNGNQQVGELCWVDTSGTSSDQPLGILSVDGLCEIDNGNDALEPGVAAFRQFKLKNVPLAWINAIELQGGGIQTAIGDLIDSHVILGTGKGNRIGGPIFARGVGDTTSTVRLSGYFSLRQSDTQGYFDGSNIIDLIPSGTTFTLPGYQGVNTIYRLNMDTPGAYTLSLVHPGVGAGGAQYPGLPFDTLFCNTSGGVTTITPAGGTTYWSLAGGALPQPTDGNYINLRLTWDQGAPLKFRELGRSGAIAI